MKIEQVRNIAELTSHLPNLLNAYIDFVKSGNRPANLVNEKLLGEMINQYISMISSFCTKCDDDTKNGKHGEPSLDDYQPMFPE